MKKWFALFLMVLIFSTSFAESDYERLQAEYAAAMGFSKENDSRPQLHVYLHNYESWKMGATWQPTAFYLDVEMPIRLLGEKSMESIHAFENYDCADMGIWLKTEGKTYSLMRTAEGVRGVHFDDRIYEAGPDFDRLLQLAESKLGYRIGDMDFLGKKIVQAQSEWLAGESPREDETYTYGGGRVVITDEKRLTQLAKRLEEANYLLGSVNCPSDAFMILEFEDGSRSEIAVAINSFSTFFYRGICFDFRNGDIIDIFNLDKTVFCKAYWG